MELQKNIELLKPDIFVHGDDWHEGPLVSIRNEVIETLDSYGGILKEFEYTKDISSTKLYDEIKIGVNPVQRKQTLKRLLNSKNISRFIEAHNPISALIGEHEIVEVQDKIKEFDGFWSSL